jgi:hypothetical protein
MRTRLSRALVAVLALAAASNGASGPLDPPASPGGRPGPEARTAINSVNTPGDDEAFFVITQPGSYYLTRNITNGVLNSTWNGIVVEASNVTIDLNGFAVDGFTGLVIPAGAQQTQGLAPPPPTTGVLASGPFRTGISVVNGVVRDWTNGGVNLTSVDGCVLERIRAEDNGGRVICVGDSSVVTRCTAMENGGDGIAVGNDSVIEKCVSSANEGSGFSVAGDSVITHCTANANAFTGILTTGGCVITECAASENGFQGINAQSGSTVIRNTCNDNATGIRVTVNCRVDSNLVHNNGAGFATASGGSLIVRNRATGNTQDHYGQVAVGNDLGTIMTTPVGAGPWDNFEP